jgi:hypothetical protein
MAGDLRRGAARRETQRRRSSCRAQTMTGSGYQLRPLLAPLSLRGRPLPRSTRVGLAVGAVALAALVARRLARR